jgi:hypothetical protein
MARYKATRKGWPNRQVEIDEEFDYDGVPGSWMEPLDDEAKEAFAKRFGVDAKPSGAPEDRRPIGAAPVGSKTPADEVVALKARIADLEALVAKLSNPASVVSDDTASPAGMSPPAQPAGSSLMPEVAAMMEKRRGRGGAQTAQKEA